MDALPARHDRASVALHWAIALLVLGLMGIGWYMTGLPRNTPERAFFFNLHKSLGMLTAALVLVRIGWRARHASPPLAAGMAAWQVRATRASHALLYALMVLQPLSGYLASSFSKFGVKFFGLALPHWGWEDKFWNGVFAATHSALAIAFAILVAVHAAAAFKHLLFDRDGVFQRMMP